MTASDVIDRALATLSLGPLPEDWRDHGQYCVLCALAMAKGQLDDEFGSGLDVMSLVSDVINIVITGRYQEFASDAALVRARDACWPFMGRLDMPQDAALSVLTNARQVVAAGKVADGQLH